LKGFGSAKAVRPRIVESQQSLILGESHTICEELASTQENASIIYGSPAGV
jgi:hypothetical protein